MKTLKVATTRHNPPHPGLSEMGPSELGLGLVEILISLVLSMLLAIALFTVLHGTLFGAISQRGMSALQEAERRAATNIQQVAHAGGYFVVSPTQSSVGPTPLSALSAATALAASTYSAPYGTFAAGQYVDGIDSAASAPTASGSVLNIRFQSALGVNPNEPPTMDCQGQSASSTTPTYYNNSYFVSPTTSSLDCSVNGATPQILVGNGKNGGIQVTGMHVLYGVDTNGSGSVTAYETALQVSNWSNVLTAQITLTYANPLYVRGDDNGQKPTIPFTFWADFMGAGGVN
jgi:Tfp pilus assembly protein PilW